jgi:hypothetical protein
VLPSPLLGPAAYEPLAAALAAQAVPTTVAPLPSSTLTPTSVLEAFTAAVSENAATHVVAHSNAGYYAPTLASLGLPVVYMEALASRIPVVASRVAGVPELVEDGVTGYTVPPGDVDTLANRMIRLMDDPAAARTMGEAGRRAVEAQHDIRTEGAWLARIFRDGGPAGRLRP